MKNKQKKTSLGRRILRVFLCVFLGFVLALLMGLVGVCIWADQQIDTEADRALFASLGESQTTRIYAKEPSKSKENEKYIWAEYDFVFAGENSTWVEYSQISPDLLHAFIAIEDHRFYRHDGVDWLRTAKATLNYMLKGEKHFGGSTITQQVVKNVCGEREVSAKRKAKEILRALRLEKEYSKEEILTMYANIVPLANSCTGVYSAADFYFGKKPNELTLLECASIAAITNSPSRYNPISHPEANEKRARLILTQMEKHGYISEEMLKTASSLTITLKEGISVLPNKPHGWFTETVLADVIQDLMREKNMSYTSAKRLVYSGGLQIMSTVDPRLQDEVTECFENETNFYPHKNVQNKPDFALVLIDPKTGDLLATAGNVGAKQANRIQNGIFAKHPPGSALKPIALYLPALEEKKVHWATVFEDMPRPMQKGDTVSLWPKNSPDVYQGRITLADALAHSKNTVAVSLYELLGAEAIARHLSRLGIDLVENQAGKTDFAPAPLALGQLTEGVSLRALTDAYTPLAGQGMYRESRSYLYVLDAKGNLLLENNSIPKRICSRESAHLMTKMLEGVTDYGTARRMSLKYTVDVAGKTGTSGGDKDRWFIGYTPDYLCGVRSSGHGSAIGENARSPLYVWDDCMKAVYRALPYFRTSFPETDGIIYSAFCPDSGELLSDSCLSDLRGPRIAYGYFTLDNRPTTHCHIHKEVYRNLFDQTPELSPHPFGFSSPFSLLDIEKKDIEEEIKTLDRPFRLWYYIGEKAEIPEKREEFPFASPSRKKTGKGIRRFW